MSSVVPIRSAAFDKLVLIFLIDSKAWGGTFNKESVNTPPGATVLTVMPLVFPSYYTSNLENRSE